MRLANRQSILFIAISVALVVLSVTACGPKGPEVNEAAEQEWAFLSEADAKLDTLRQELADLKASLAAAAEQAAEEAAEEAEPAIAEIEAQIEEKKAEIQALGDELQGRIGKYLNDIDPMYEGEPPTERQLAVIRMKSDEDILVGAEWIREGGDYKKAMSIYSDALALDPDNEALKAALAKAEEMRFMTEERLAQVAKGMSQDQVLELLGPVNLRNIRDYPEKKVLAWFYPVNDKNEAAAVWFRKKNDEFVVYRTNFEEVRGDGEEDA